MHSMQFCLCACQQRVLRSHLGRAVGRRTVVHLRMRAHAFTAISRSLFDTDKPIPRNNQRVLGARVRGTSSIHSIESMRMLAALNSAAAFRTGVAIE
jgi:hypothetical protein